MERLKTSLRQALERIEKSSESSSKEAEAKVMVPEVADAVVNENMNSNNPSVLQFYSKLPKPDDVLKVRIRESAREMLLMKKNQDLLAHDELTELYRILEKHASPPFGSEHDEKFIGFRNYKKMVATLSPKFQKLLTPPDGPAFIKLITDDPFMRVSITVIFNYIMRKTWLSQTRIAMSMYDDSGEGFIKEPQLENYIKDLIGTLTQLNAMDQTFLPFYLCTAVRKFFFFLDTNKTGRIKILDILASGLIDELLDLREDESPPPTNWFSLESSMRVYGHYMNLDKDKNGMLSPDELVCYSSGEMSLTPTFVKHVFQECLTYEGEMDYRTYLDFVLAVENPREIQSMKYFFRIMDIHNKGYLDAFTLHYFYKDIMHAMEVHKTEIVNFNDVKDEIFDMIKPKDPLKITLQDLLQSGCGRALFMIFTDFNGFWAHENKEAIAMENQNQNQAKPVAPMPS